MENSWKAGWYVGNCVKSDWNMWNYGKTGFAAEQPALQWNGTIIEFAEEEKNVYIFLFFTAL